MKFDQDLCLNLLELAWTLVRRTQPSGPLCLWQCFHYLTTMAQQPVPRTLFYVFSADVSTAPKEGRIYPCKDILLDVVLSSVPQSQHLEHPLLVDTGCHRNAFTGSCLGKCNVREARLSSGLLVLCPPAAVGRRSVRQAGATWTALSRRRGSLKLTPQWSQLLLRLRLFELELWV